MKIQFRQPSEKQLNRELFFLILSCSGGAGHIRAAEALHRTAPLTGLPIRTEHYDVLDFTSKLFKRLYSESYLLMVNRAPELWGYLYQQSERKPYEKKGFIKSFDQFNYKRYLRTLRGLNPDAIICTHFLPYISISSTLRKNGITAPVFAVTTDFDIHQLWVDSIVERYFVFHEESAWQLQSKQVPVEKIKVSGIPVMPEFQLKRKPGIARRELGINTNGFTVMVLSGGFGIGRLKDIVEQTVKTLATFQETKFNLLVVCGKNDKTRDQLRTVHFPENINPKIFGFVTNIHQIMDASDILISKAGGLTSSEAMAKSLPMLIVDPIPGQESRNSDMIIEHGAGWKAINIANLSYKLRRILELPSMLANARASTHHLAKPKAATTIITNIYRQLQLKKYLSR
jgi:processive 1,2-diacylglycerol beta-glucosyltransferase